MNDARLPIAIISANRLAFFVCKIESFDAVNESSEMFSHDTKAVQTKMVVDSNNENKSIIMSAKQQLASNNQKCCGLFNRCRNANHDVHNNTKESQSQFHSKLIQRGINLAEKTVRAFNNISTSIVVGPLKANVNDWTNATAIKGEKLRLTMKKEEIRVCLYQCTVSTNMLGGKSKGSRPRHIFVDETSAQLYILEACNIHTRQQHFKATGPIRVIIDLFYLQQIHIDQIDEKALVLMLDDNVGRSFRLEFR